MSTFDTTSGRLIFALLNDGYVVTDQGPGIILLKQGANSALVVSNSDHGLDLLPPLRDLGAATIALIGGGKPAKKRLKKARPFFTEGRVYLHQIDDSGKLWNSNGKRTPLGKLMAKVDTLPVPDPATLDALIRDQLADVDEQVTEVNTFQHVLSQRRPVATLTLMAIIALFFGGEMLWGGSETMPTLVRMGALVRERALGAEAYRLLSCTFLHGDLMHLAFNAYVLYALGSSLERILGTERFLVLYVTSAVGGSLASTVFLGEGVSVGASGAIWGLLAAEGVLAYRPGGLLPTAMLPDLKRIAMVNLGLNIVNSFRPEVDWAAHLGGGVIGGILLLTGILTIGLPHHSELEPDAEKNDRKPGWLRPSAALLTGLLMSGGVYALVAGAPWALTETPTVTRIPLDDTGLTIALPSSLPAPTRDALNPLSRVYGDVLNEPVFVETWAMKHPTPLSDERVKMETESLRAALVENIPADASVSSTPRVIVDGPQHFIMVGFKFSNGIQYERAAVLTPEFLVRVDLVIWPAFYEGVLVGGAEAAVRSIR